MQGFSVKKRYYLTNQLHVSATKQQPVHAADVLKSEVVFILKNLHF
jgi:hypothetical protein